LKEIRALLLAAGLGTRLRPYTDYLPKCLMPVSGHPLLEHWLCSLNRQNVSKVLVNTHHHSDLVRKFLARKQFEGWVDQTHEQELLGTAGTLQKNWQYFKDSTTLLIHSDNWCQCDFGSFLKYHILERPTHTVMTMMVFNSEHPKASGIVELDDNNIVVHFTEKPSHPKTNLANGAVYILEPEVIESLGRGQTVVDFSTEVIPKYMGRIATWKNNNIHRDIGVIEALKAAQSDPKPDICWTNHDSWSVRYRSNSVVRELESLAHE